MIGLLFVSLIASTSGALAPIVPSPPRPPIVIPFTPHAFRPRTGVTQTIAVQVRQDGRIIWSGELTRSSTGNAAFNQDVRESHACPGADHVRFGGGGSVSSGLNISIGPDFRGSSDPDADNGVQVMVSRTRPLSGGDACAESQASSTVRFSATTKLVRGRAVTLTGEGGLLIALMLR